MTRLHCLLAMSLGLTLIACGPAGTSLTPAPGTEVPTQPASPGGAVTPAVSMSTASVGTALPSFMTALPTNYTPPPTPVPPTLTPIPPLPGGLGPTELKYRVLAQFPDFFFCDPDYYPIARADEMDLARQRFPELQTNAEEFNTILAHQQLTGLTTFTDDQKLLIYREHKKLAALQFELTAGGYQFQLQSAKSEGEGELITGFIDSQGALTVQQKTASFATCPICLAANTLIDTPRGPVRVTELRVGMTVWTATRAGARVAAPLLGVGKTFVPATHQVIHLQLDDGRNLWASPGHPTADGRTLRQLQAGDRLDGARVVLIERLPYTRAATYDLLPAGETGFYWANGILMGSTLLGSDFPGLEDFGSLKLIPQSTGGTR